MNKVIFLILIIILLYLLYKHQKEYFTRNPIFLDEDLLTSDEMVSEGIYFKYLDRDLSQFRIESTDYANLLQVPELKFYSYDTCPNLYNLFHGFKLKDSTTNKYMRGENTQGIEFRNECEKVFYNTDLFVRIEHPIIDIEAEDTEIGDTPPESDDNKFQDFKFICSNQDSKPILNYLNKYSGRFCNFEKELKQINFQVKSDFSIEDIYRYLDFCYTQLCFGMIYIENMKLTSNHYRVFPCPCRKGAFFILPERIRHQVSMQGKEYTRAKCNTCCLNLITLFGKSRPEKFDFIYEFDSSESCYASSDIFKENLNSIEF